MNNIYEFVISRGDLIAKHKEELQKKRGLTEETITRNRFISGGEYFINLEQELLGSFAEEALLEAGVFHKPAGSQKVAISPLLLEPKIIIPYLDKEGKAYYIRPHKLGLKDIAIEIYQELNVGKNIILTEGEFKAAAAMQLGFNSIAIPGIGSFSDQHFPRLLKFLNDNKVRDICIIFDNEIKDNPHYPKRYKENPADRHDTEFYAYFMAKMLDKESFNVRIAWLPDGWRVDGKADIDGALALGKTKEEFDTLIYQAKTFRIFLEELPREAQQIIQRKNAKKYFKSHIGREFGKYIAKRRRGKTEWEEVISNFTIRIIATHETIEGMVREVQFTNEFGQTTPTFPIGPADMSSSDTFAIFCLSHGNYIWRGNKEDLNNIWEAEFLNDDGRHIIEPDHIGWVESEGIWLFGNVAVNKEGKEMRADRNHVFWTEKKGLKPIPLGITSGKTTISEGIPYLNLTPVKLEDIRIKFAETLGDMPAALCLGWVTAVVFLEEIFDAYGCFPFLFITGRRSSGKSTIAEWLMNFFGLENAGKMASDTTQVGIQRYLSYYSSLPVFLDEFRNTKQITMKNGFLRNAYNRQSAGKGIKADFGIREAKIRGTLVIAGEETPEDNALLTRCIIVLVSEKNRKINNFNWFMANRIKFSNHFYNLIKTKKETLPLFMRVLGEAKEFFVSQGADDRTAINFAVISAGHAVAFGEGNVEFERWITTETGRVQAEYQEEQAVAGFLEDLLAMKTKGLVNTNYWAEEDGKIYLYFHGLYNIYSQEYRKTRGIEPFKASSIRDYLKEENGFIAVSEVKKIKGHTRKCMVFDSGMAPMEIRSLAEDAGIPEGQAER